jgi:hypothetical protein
MTTAEADHKCSFPVNPPGGSFTNPGACECGKTYARSEAERMLAEAEAAMAETEPGTPHGAPQTGRGGSSMLPLKPAGDDYGPGPF